MITVFTLASGRSGTRFLSGLLSRNVKGVVSKHEPYVAISNPNMFGMHIYHRLRGNLEPIREAVRRKHDGIRRYKAAVYIETSHAFLKSYADVAIEFFPNMKLIHLIRNPLKTARSEANRHLLLDRFHWPFRTYRGDDGDRYFRWALTGREQIFRNFDPDALTMFQWYVLQWIEIENRAMQFLDRHQKHGDCFTLDSPHDLSNPTRIVEMLRFFNLEQVHPEIHRGGHRNRTPGTPTVVHEEEERQFRDVIDRLPAEHLEVFQSEPYVSLDWSPLR